MRDLLEKYIEDIKKRNLSRNTLDAYVRDIELFEEFLAERSEDLSSVDDMTVMAYIQRLNREGKAHSSVTRNIVSIRSFFRYLVKNGLLDKAPDIEYEMPRNERAIPEILTIEEVDRLLSVPDMDCCKGVRDKAMLELMYATGIKVSEMLSLTIQDLNLKMRYIRCHGMKGKERIIPFGSYAVQYLEQYLSRRDDVNPRGLKVLFLNSQGECMSRQGFWKIVKAYSRKAGIGKDINLYTLRHSFAVHLLQNGADMKSLQELLGHTDISATQIYLNMTDKNKLMEVYKNTHPRA